MPDAVDLAVVCGRGVGGEGPALLAVRPTLVLGLGGTGVLACRWVEEYVRRRVGHVPPFLRFLQLDTDVPVWGGPPNASTADHLNLLKGRDLAAVCLDYAAHPTRHPHLAWMRHEGLEWGIRNNMHMPGPHLGRLAFVELREAVVRPAVMARFHALGAAPLAGPPRGQARFAMGHGAPPIVHMVCSVCGGTGAGMLLDAAYAVRWWSRECFPRQAEVVAHLVLPEAFRLDPLLRGKLEAWAATMLEQIELVCDGRRDDLPVRYRGTCAGAHRFGRDEPPLDLAYLVGGAGRYVAHLDRVAKTIARMIRAMAIEPLGAHLAARAAIARADVLQRLHPVSGRRRLFSTYELACGEAGGSPPGEDAGGPLRAARVRHGLSLDELEGYGSYVRANAEYLAQRGWEREDLWLDRGWYVAYRRARRQWARQVERFR